MTALSLSLSLSLASLPVPGPRVAPPTEAPVLAFGAVVGSPTGAFLLAPAPTSSPPAAPGDTTPDGTAPEGTPPEGSSPEGTPTDGTPTDVSGSSEGTPAERPPADGEPPKDPKPAGGEPGELGIDDIFGTEEDHTDVMVVSEKGEPADAGGTDAGPTNAPPAAATRRPLVRGDKLKTQVRIVSSAYYDTARVDERGFGRNENRLEFYFAYTPNQHLQIVGDVEPVFFGVAQAKELDDLATRQMLEPFHIESDAAYVALNDVLPNLDIKVGRQTLVWGTADKFNPTNNINPDDLEDRPLFTEPIANQMIVVDYAPLADKLWFQGVYVPIFYPALLPPSAAAALKDPQAPVPYANQSDLDKLGELQQLLEIDPALVPVVQTHVMMPKARFTNGQSAIKLGTSLGGVDMSFSYYNGRHDIPLPVLATSELTKPREPGDGAECCYTSDVTLIYPRMQVIGADFSTQLPFLGNMGLWGEGALFLPRAQDFRIEFPVAVDVTPDDGMANPVQELEGPTIRTTPYIKATAGLDYSFGEHVYVQGQYLRGFIDEFGADHIGNYIVGGTDLIFFGRHLIFRMFGVVDLPTGRGDNGSYVLYPELILVPPWGSVTFELGSFFLLGPSDTKFGQAATGSSIAFFKVAGTF
ncbi:DUF1302 family protein [Paraliomyxa miuraensis]|uniref:DUF1302 family protein n=1 Tax=Paraliomyxa miuraensis TaxID=376150 RepID=UPI002256D5CB|nr:DUF1302 family protein [Paraliomyxa miuraensis]MCX4242902.1 hypothetical protein [Paraliomyxa miuraensis]